MQTTRRQLLAHSAVLPFLPLVGLGLTACSTVETTSVQARLRGKSITVISTIGTTLRLTWRGTTLFNNEFGEAFVPDWGYKEQLENRTVELLRASGRFSSVQRVTITATRREEALKELKELKTPTDHVLLISGAPSADSIWATREGFFGLGIAQRSILQLGTESVAHASLRVDLLVPSTFGTVLGEATVSTAQRVPAPERRQRRRCARVAQGAGGRRGAESGEPDGVGEGGACFIARGCAGFSGTEACIGSRIGADDIIEQRVPRDLAQRGRPGHSGAFGGWGVRLPVALTDGRDVGQAVDAFASIQREARHSPGVMPVQPLNARMKLFWF